MMFPTRSIRSGDTPSRNRLASASGDGVHSKSEIEGVLILAQASGSAGGGSTMLQKPFLAQ